MLSDKDQIKQALEDKFMNPTLLEYDVKNQIVLIKNNDEYCVFKYIENSDQGMFFQDGRYLNNIRDDIDAYEVKTLKKSNDFVSILSDEIKNIEKNIESLKVSFENIDRAIETFSPNLFGENGYLEEYKRLDENEKLEFSSKINSLLKIDINEIINSTEIVSRAVTLKNEIIEKLEDFESNLKLIKNEYQKISTIVNHTESLFAKDELLSFIENEQNNDFKNNTNLK